jgi:hypothetical protein
MSANKTGAKILGLKKVAAYLKRGRQKSKKAMNTALKVRAFKLKNLLQKDLRQGKAGQKRFNPLTFISRRANGRPNRKALSKLSMGVRYRIAKQDPFRVEVGFVKTVSKSFRNLATKHQEGFSRVISEKQRGFIINRGAKLGKISSGDTPFFLAKNTRIFTTPARPIIDPFWMANKGQSVKKIRRDYRAKMKGQRI